MADETLRALGRVPVVVTGRLNKWQELVLGTLLPPAWSAGVLRNFFDEFFYVEDGTVKPV